MNNIAKKVKSKGIKQSWIAEQLNTTDITVSGWTTGRTTPSLEHAIKLADLLGCTVEELWG